MSKTNEKISMIYAKSDSVALFSKPDFTETNFQIKAIIFSLRKLSGIEFKSYCSTYSRGQIKGSTPYIQKNQ